MGQKLFWTLQKLKVSIKHQSISSRHVYLHCVSDLTHPKSLSQTFKHHRQHLSAREISRIQDLTLFSQLFSDGHRTKVFLSLCLLCLIRNWLWDVGRVEDWRWENNSHFQVQAISRCRFIKLQNNLRTKLNCQSYFKDLVHKYLVILRSYFVSYKISWG